jgi:streptomycin 6-kinase
MLNVPAGLAASCDKSPERLAWLSGLPDVVNRLEREWSLAIGEPFDTEEVSCSYVAPAVRSDGTSVVLKITMPHMEGRDEIAGLRFWCGDPTVRLLEADETLGAMLLERCEPGTLLRELDENDQDRVIAGLLSRLWREPPQPHPFRPLSALTSYWTEETLTQVERWPDPALVREGLRLF